MCVLQSEPFLPAQREVNRVWSQRGCCMLSHWLQWSDTHLMQEDILRLNCLYFHLFRSVCYCTCCSPVHYQTHWLENVLYPFHRFQKENTDVGNENSASDHSVICEAEDSFMCSVTLETTTSFHIMVTVSIANTTAPPLLLRVPARPGRTESF